MNKQTPDLLLDKMVEVNEILAKQPNSKNKEFWKSVAEIMLQSYNFMTELKFIHKQNELLTAENTFLKHWASSLNDRLTIYESIRTEITKGTLDETINTVSHAIEKET